MNYNDFKKRSDKVMNDWNKKGCKKAVDKLVKEGKILSADAAAEQGLTYDEAFDKFWDDVEEEFNNNLNAAVGGDWHEVGQQVGLTDVDLEHIYVDEYQAKTDPFVDIYEELDD